MVYMLIEVSHVEIKESNRANPIDNSSKNPLFQQGLELILVQQSDLLFRRFVSFSTRVNDRQFALDPFFLGQ